MILQISLQWVLIWSFIFLLIVTCIYLAGWIIYDCNSHVKEMKEANARVQKLMDQFRQIRDRTENDD